MTARFALGLILAAAGLLLVAASGGTPNGGLVFGLPLFVAGISVLWGVRER